MEKQLDKLLGMQYTRYKYGELSGQQVLEENEMQSLYTSLSHLWPREKEFLAFLLQNRIYEFTQIEVSKMLGITNRADHLTMTLLFFKRQGGGSV